MKPTKTNPSLTYSKLNTVLLILLLVLAVGVLYVTTQQDKTDETMQTTTTGISSEVAPRMTP